MFYIISVPNSVTLQTKNDEIEGKNPLKVKHTEIFKTKLGIIKFIIKFVWL